MDNSKAVVIKNEWIEGAMSIIRFFFQHSTIELDGEGRKAKVHYHGPSGWKVSIDTSFDPNIQLNEQMEMLKD